MNQQDNDPCTQEMCMGCINRTACVNLMNDAGNLTFEQFEKIASSIRYIPETEEDFLEQEHQRYIKQRTESGLPTWIADMYAHAQPNPSTEDTNTLKSNITAW